ncbi:MAG: hypothetical protein ABIR83_00180 [Nakamurella sp.]
MLLVGQILDIVEPGPVKTTTGYRWAFVAILVLTAFGLFRLTVWWLRVRRQLLELQDAGGQGPVEVHRHRFDRSVGPAVDAPARVEGGTP